MEGSYWKAVHGTDSEGIMMKRRNVIRVVLKSDKKTLKS